MSWLHKIFEFRESAGTDEGVKPFLDHLEDLRWTLIKMAGSLGIAMIGCFALRKILVQVIQLPLLKVDPDLHSLRSLGVADSMTISFQLAFYAGVVVAFPFMLYFLAEFVLPGMTKREKKVVLPAVLVGFGLFLGGVLFSYFVVLPAALAFFFNDARSLDWSPEWTVREYYSFVTNFSIAFGLSFELPVIVLALVKLGLLNHAILRKFRPHALVLIFIFAAVITPTQDVLTLLLMGGPMYVLYEICVIISRFMTPNEARAAGVDDPAAIDDRAENDREPGE